MSNLLSTLKIYTPKRSWSRLLICILTLGMFYWSALATVQAQEAGVPASSTPPTITQFSMNAADGGLFLTAQMQFSLGSGVEQALKKGVPVVFAAEADIYKSRWYWYDKKVASAARYFRLVYHPITKKWRLSVASSISGLSASSGLAQSFDDQEQALRALRRITMWRVADTQDWDIDADYSVDFKFRLDTSQMPRPLQIGLIGQSDWNLSLEKTAKFSLTAVKP